MPTMDCQVSVIVCTYNRASLLAQVLATLCKQVVDPSSYEIIVVDNQSTDQTRAVVTEFQEQHANIRYILETEIGISHARNRGFQEAVGEYIAYVDDDCKVPPHWMAVAQEIIREVRPALFGGPFYAFYNVQKPAWYKDAYGSQVLSDVARRLIDMEFLSGLNMVFERTVLAHSGGFRGDLGMKANIIAYGEETALQIHIRETIPEAAIYYEPRLYVFHLVRPEKMTWPRIVRARFASGRYSRVVFAGGRAIKWTLGRVLLRAFRTLLFLSGDASFGCWLRDRDKYPYIQNYWYEETLRYLAKLGGNYEELRAVWRQAKVDGVFVYAAKFPKFSVKRA